MDWLIGGACNRLLAKIGPLASVVWLRLVGFGCLASGRVGMIFLLDATTAPTVQAVKKVATVVLANPMVD